MKLKRKYIQDKQGVSPVIAVILMLAITVILASVAYIMFTGLIPSAESSKMIPVDVTLTADGKNWSVTVISSPGGMNSDNVYVITRNITGEILINRTALSAFPGFIDIDPVGEVNGGDYLLIAFETHPYKSTLELVSESNVLAHRVLE